jgi:hypothetical protein
MRMWLTWWRVHWRLQTSYSELLDHPPPIAWKVTDSTIMRKWKWLFMNGCKCKSLICSVTEFLNLCQNGTNASVCSGIMFKIVILHWNEWATFNVVMASHLIHMTEGISINILCLMSVFSNSCWQLIASYFVNLARSELDFIYILHFRCCWFIY